MAQGQAAQPDPGLIYILTNAVMPGVVKIGLTRRDDVAERLRELWTTGVPVPFECYYCARVPNCGRLEKVLHRVFGEKRIRPDREFFTSDPALAELIIDLVKIDNAPMSDAEQGITPEVRAVIEQEKASRAPRLDFEALCIPAGTVLAFTRDPSITCVVVGPTKVTFQGESISPSAAALRIMQALGHKWTSINGWEYWTYEGVRLAALRRQESAPDARTATGLPSAAERQWDTGDAEPPATPAARSAGPGVVGAASRSRTRSTTLMSKRKNPAQAASEAADPTTIAPPSAPETPDAAPPAGAAAETDAPESLRTKIHRANTKVSAVIEKLQTPEGATVEELQALTGWQPHSVRGAIAGSIKKTFGLAITSTKEERGRVYRAVTPVAD